MKQAMFSALVEREVLGVVRSPRFTAIFVVCSLLIIVSVLAGIREYRASKNEFDSGRQIASDLIRERSTWVRQINRAYREPDPMQILVSGVALDVGRWSPVGEYYVPRARGSTFAENSILALFRYIDLSFIVMTVVSLLALVLSHNAICGEKEAGTLRLVFSNAVPRTTYILAKCAGCWLGIIVPLLVPVLASILLIVLSGLFSQPSEWLRLFGFLFLSGLQVTFWVVFGVLVSCLTNRATLAFLVGLSAWVVVVFVYPRAAVAFADQATGISSIGSLEAQRTAYSEGLWEDYMQNMDSRMQEYYRGWNLEDTTILARVNASEETLREEIQQSISGYEMKLVELQRNAQREKQQLAKMLCSISPAATYQLGAMEIAQTDMDMKYRFESAVEAYRRTFVTYLNKKQTEDESSSPQTVTFRVGDGTTVSLRVPYSTKELDLSDMPEFRHEKELALASLSRATTPACLQLLYTCVSLLCAMKIFNNYDLR